MRLLGSIDIPIEAQFGVLTSGTTGMPKHLWRTEKSWADYFDIQNDIFHINHATRIFVHGSFSFTGNTNMMLAVLWAGGQIVTSDKMQFILINALIFICCLQNCVYYYDGIAVLVLVYNILLQAHKL